MHRAVIYLRVSTLDQTTANQERELREVADRMSGEIVRVYKDHGISGGDALTHPWTNFSPRGGDHGITQQKFAIEPTVESRASR
jgi:hypothetical protein